MWWIFVLELDIPWDFEALDILLEEPIEGSMGFLDEHWHDDNTRDFSEKLFIVARGANPMYNYSISHPHINLLSF